MGTAGIKKALIKEPKKNVKQYGSGYLVELSPSESSFTAYVDKSCLGPGTRNPENTIRDVKWFLVREHLWNAYKQLYPQLSPSEFFNTLKTSNEENKDYKILEGNNRAINVSDVKNGIGNIGVIYLLIPYNVFPETNGVEVLRVVATDRPQVLYCNFKFPKEGSYIPLQDSDKKAAYGQTVDVEVYTHLLPDWHNNLQKFVFDVELVNKGKVVSKKERVEITNPGAFHYNAQKSLRFLIDPEWQKNHNSQKQDEKFYLRLRGYIDFTGPVLTPNGSVSATGQYDSEQATSDWVRLENGKWIYDSSRELLVPYDTLSSLLGQFETQKNNQIQYIGDIQYKKREYDPCGYSKITIKDEEDGDRTPLVIFDEEDTKNPIDRTSQIFGITAGDKRKKISITLDKLTTKDVFCQGLLLDEGQKHTVQTNVFQVNKVFAAQRDSAGFNTQTDKTHSQQQQNADITPTNENRTDTDVIKTNKSYNPSQVQQWTAGTDYKFEGDSKMLLMPKYNYNKTFLQGRTSTYTANAANILWLFNYFILNEDLAQNYFVPISTCRYPNQIAKIKVYPDIEWEVAFLITIGRGYTGKIKYTRERLNAHHQNYNMRYLGSELNIDATQSSNLGWVLKAKAVENGKEHEIGIESVKKVVDTAVAAFNMTRQYFEVFNPGNSDGTPSLAQSRRVIEVDFAIDPPNVGFALGWKFGKASNNEIVPIYTGGLRADPLIGLTVVVDLVPLIKFLGPIGRVISWIIQFIEWLSKSDLYITFEVSFPVKADLSLSYNRVDGFANRGKQKMWVEPGVTLRAGCKSNEVVFIPTTTRNGVTETTEVEKWKVEGNVATSLTFEKEWGYDKNQSKYYEKSTVNFKGAKMTIVISELISNRRIDFKPTHQQVFTIIEEPKDPIYDSGKIYIEEKK
ncbi:hypothetical protein [Chryseobacterium tongliaoense]|uniref:hypothetical protein n=1 Tax=Chryseobacterium tongliaoense TaxID=3240933 RepID=UPI003518F19D